MLLERGGFTAGPAEPSVIAANLQRSESLAVSSLKHGDLSYARLATFQEKVSAAIMDVAGRNPLPVLIACLDPLMTLVAVLGAMKHATAIPQDAAATQDELMRAVSGLSPPFVAVSDGTAEGLHSLAENEHWPELHLSLVSTKLEIDLVRTLPRSGTVANHVVPGSGQIALRTSGTTGSPKTIVLSASNLRSAVASLSATLALSAQDRCLNLMPLDHTLGLITCCFAPLATGGQIILCSDFKTEEIPDYIESWRPTWVSAVPPIFHGLVALSRRGSFRTPFPFRFLRSTAAPLGVVFSKELELEFGLPVIEAYALTEAPGQVTSNRLPPHRRKLGTVGPASVDTVRIQPQQMDSREGECSGEVLVRGANVAIPLSKSGPAPAAGEWLSTGDTGYVDEDGFLVLTGRLSEVINRGGNKIWPHEVEFVLVQHPHVGDAAVIALPHPTLGEIPVAAIVSPQGPIEVADLRAFLARRLSNSKIPDRFISVESILRTRTGKIDRPALSEQLKESIRAGHEDVKRRRQRDS